MASLDSFLPSDGSAVWRRDRKPEFTSDSHAVRHVVIRGTEVLSEPSPHVVYRIDVLTEHSHWYICRRYSEFHDLHRKLVRRYKISREMLPPKKLSGNFSHQLIKQRKQQLEQYLQKLINSEVQISQSSELLVFLDVPAHDVVRVAELLARQLYSIGDQLLEKGMPIALTINDLHCITRRLRLPMDPQHNNDPSADLGHLYSFLHQIVSLKVIPPPAPSSVTRMAFEITHFKSLEILKIEYVPLSQISGLVRVQQQLQKISIHHTLKSLREVLVDAVEERRMQGAGEPKQLTESWRLVATAKFTSNRVVIQPWNKLVTLNISHNKITCLDDSLQVLPALKEFNASHNLLVHLDLQHLCLPYLTNVNLSHNHITTVASRRLVIESVQELNLSDNGLFDLSFVVAFVSVHKLNLNDNRVSSKRELDHLSNLKALRTLQIKGNPIMASGAARIVLMAKFVHKAKTISVDGSEPTSGEQTRIRQLMKRYGTDIDRWPVAQSLKAQNPPIISQEESPSPVPPSPPSVHVSWTVESLKKPISPGDSSPSPSHSTCSAYSEGSFDNPLFTNSPIFTSHATGRLSKESSTLMSLRDEPDGRSDISNEPSDSVVPTTVPSPFVLSTPPCTPMSADTQMTTSNVTPQLISAALEVLSQAASSTPNEESQLPSLLSQALNDFISGTSSKCATPPSTPLDQDEHAAYPVSANDLISALTSTLTAHCELNKSSDNLSGSGGAPSVPFGTPREGGGLSELSRLEIQPELLLAALNTLKNKKEEEQRQPLLQLDVKKTGGEPLTMEREEKELLIEVSDIEGVAKMKNADEELGKDLTDCDDVDNPEDMAVVTEEQIPLQLETLDTAVEEEKKMEKNDEKETIEDGAAVPQYEDQERHVVAEEEDTEVLVESEIVRQQNDQKEDNNSKEVQEETEITTRSEDEEEGRKEGEDDVLYIGGGDENPLYHAPSGESIQEKEEEEGEESPKLCGDHQLSGQDVSSIVPSSGGGPQQVFNDDSEREPSSSSDTTMGIGVPCEDIVQQQSEGTPCANERVESSPKDSQKSQSPGMPTRYKLIGLVVISVGIYSIVQSNKYDLMGDEHYTNGGILLIVSGTITFGIAGLGFVGACLKWRPLLVLYLIVLTIIVILEIIAGILGLVYRDQVFNQTESSYRTTLQKAIEKYDEDDDNGLDRLQKALKCCGADNYTDWLELRNDTGVPASCDCDGGGSKCETVEYDFNGDTINQTVYRQGCIDATIEFSRDAAYVIGGVGIAFGMFEIIGIIIAIGLVIWISVSKEGYEVV